MVGAFSIVGAAGCGDCPLSGEPPVAGAIAAAGVAVSSAGFDGGLFAECDGRSSCILRFNVCQLRCQTITLRSATPRQKP